MPGEFGTHVSADHQAEQDLYEEHEIEVSGKQVAKTAESGNRQDDQHGGADGMVQRHGKEYQQRELDELGRSETEGARQEAIADTGQSGQKPETAAGEIGTLPLFQVEKRQVRVSQAGIDEDGGSDQHGCRKELEFTAWQERRDFRADKSAASTGKADGQPDFDIHVPFPEMAECAGKCGEYHGRQ